MSKRMIKNLTAIVLCALLVMTQVIGVMPVAQSAQAAPGDYFSTYDVAYSPDGTMIAATDATKGTVVIINASAGTVTRTIALNGTPRTAVWKDNTYVFVAEYDAAGVAEVNATTGAINRRFATGPKAFGLAYISSTSKLYVTDFGLNKVSVVDVATGTVSATVTLPDNYPNYITVTPDNAYAIVGYATPTGSANSSTYASRVTFITLSSNTISSTISLPHGSTNVRGIKCSPNGTWAYVAHMLGRTNLPTTQLTKGWVYTDAISVVQLSTRTLYTTFLLDRMEEGASAPWGLAVSSDSNTLWVSVSGPNQVFKIDMNLLNSLMGGTIPATYIQSGANLSLPNMLQRKKYRYTRPFSDVWFQIKADGTKRSLLKNDLGALWGAGVITKVQLEASANPRGIALSPDGTKLAVAGFFTGKVYTITASTAAIAQTIALGAQPADDQVRTGYKQYFDTTLSQQKWTACASCHPEGRPDGMNWDLMNDGAGNPKNAKSHLNAQMTAPSMSHGIRKDYTVAVDAGWKYLRGVMPTQTMNDNIAAFISSLTPEKDPFRNADGTMTANALTGKALFDANCASCHSGPYMTDYQLHTTTHTDSLDSNQSFDTPSLVEVWRTAPYLHDGSALTIVDAMTALGYGSSLNATQKQQVADYILQFGASTASLGNQAPKVTAGYDWLHIQGANTYTLSSAACTDDGLPNPPAAVTYTWSKTSGPTATFDNVNILNPVITFTGGVGTYVLQISAYDGALTSTDTCTITVVNATPTPTASVTPTPTNTPTPTPRNNIAIGKTVTYDSQQTGNEATKAVDNNIGTRWCANDGNLNHWIKVDLGSSQAITGSEVYWESAGYNYKYKVESSADNTVWTMRADQTAYAGTNQLMTDNWSASARYVRITVTGLASGRWASCFEFRIFNN